MKILDKRMDVSCLLFHSCLSLFNPFVGDSRCADRVRELTTQKSFRVNTEQLCTDYGLYFSLLPSLRSFEAEFIPTTTAQLCLSFLSVDCSAITLCAHQTSVIVFFRYGCKIKIINGGAGGYV